ncbi:MAG TPA: HTH domain-containing protein [Candidatus Limnocylindrales bacterium]|nr:HTH domain-containing protein [Candidatus Limnocylindrales bacterium]
MTIAEAAEQILIASREPMHAAAIAKAIAEKGLYVFRAKDPGSMVAGALYKRIQTLGDDCAVKKVGPSQFTARR